MFDEGAATAGFNSCCGWNPVKAADLSSSNAANPLKPNPDGTWSAGHVDQQLHKGQSRPRSERLLRVEQPAGCAQGPDRHDAYSHFSFVRTLQDMFGLADPKVDASYMDRTKYTERFIAQNIVNLPEYAGSADTHFDAVRPMNHAYRIPSGYTQKQSSDIDTAATPAQVGPDATQVNLWAVK